MSARSSLPMWAAAVALLPLLSGCLSAMDDYYAFDPDEYYENPGVFLGNYTFDNGGSSVLEKGTFAVDAPEIVRLVSTLPHYPEPVAGAITAESTVYIPMAIWRPQNFTGEMPVIVDAGPYFEQDVHCAFPTQRPCREFIDDTIDYPSQRTPFLIENYVPKGYAVVQLAVRGTGTAGGCMDLMGPSEVHDLDQAITWLGEQPWSNGNVAMIGTSYDGSTPWEVASVGNPHLKTIVPISGLPDMFDLMFHNGSSETRGAGMYLGSPVATPVEGQSANYWLFGFDDDFPQEYPQDWPDGIPVNPPAAWPTPQNTVTPVGGANGREDYQDRQNLLCPEAAKAISAGQTAIATGDRMGAANDFWTIRDHRQAVLDNYEGSVFLIHGLQDWNVDPHSAIPYNVALREKGLEMKEWYGQWGHATPDSSCRQAVPKWVTLPCRLDYAEVLGRWFDHYLKDEPSLPLGPAIQVQDNVGQWRNAEAFPDGHSSWSDFHLNDAGIAIEPGPDSRVELRPAAGGGPSAILTLKGEPLEEDLHLSGQIQVKVPFEVQGPGGELGVWILDEEPEHNKVRAPGAACIDPPSCRKWQAGGIGVIAHGQMNLRYYLGGETAQTLQPDTQYIAQMELEPAELLVPAGHRLVVWIFQFTYPEHQSTLTPSIVTVILGPDAIIRLPVLDLDPTTVFPVPGSNFPSRDNLTLMYALEPRFTSDLPATVPTGLTPASEGTMPTGSRSPPGTAPLNPPCLACL